MNLIKINLDLSVASRRNTSIVASKNMILVTVKYIKLIDLTKLLIIAMYLIGCPHYMRYKYNDNTWGLV